MDENQIILVDKPTGISSFGVVAKIRVYLRNQFGHKVKVGHTGTLDPFATGLLILLSGKMTKQSSEFLKLDKIYEATLKLGYTSTTGDPEGQIQQYPSKNLRAQLGSREATEPRKDGREGACPKRVAVESSLQKFVGKIDQTPPRFSAIKINGQRAYKLARQGKDFEIPSRKVEIYSINILGYNYPELRLRIHCSSGTYIRTLAEDIGEVLGTGAYLTALRRIKIANYNVDNALPLSYFTQKP